MSCLLRKRIKGIFISVEFVHYEFWGRKKSNEDKTKDFNYYDNV